MLQFDAGVFSTMGMISFGLALVKIAVGLLFARAMLYYFDKITKFDFKEWLKNASPKNITFYVSVRFAVVFWFVASLLRV